MEIGSEFKTKEGWTVENLTVETLRLSDKLKIHSREKKILYKIPVEIAIVVPTLFIDLKVGDIIHQVEHNALYSPGVLPELYYIFWKLVKKNIKSFRWIPCDIFGTTRTDDISRLENLCYEDYTHGNFSVVRYS